MIEIAENAQQRKSIERTLAVKSVLPGLLAMHQWGRITIEGFALATETSYPQAQRMLHKLRLKGLVSSVRAVAVVGAGPVMYGITSYGHETLVEESISDIGAFRQPTTKVAFTSKFRHKHGLINTMIVAKNSIEKIPGGYVDLAKTEFRDGSRGGSGLTSICYTYKDKSTTITPDAEIQAGIERGGEVRRFFIEYDRGTRPVSSARYSKLGETVINQLSRYWDLLESQDAPFKVLFLTTSETRIHNIIDQAGPSLSGERHEMTFDRVFRFATHNDAVGQACSGKPRIYGDFSGNIWRSPTSEVKRPLLLNIEAVA